MDDRIKVGEVERGWVLEHKTDCLIILLRDGFYSPCFRTGLSQTWNQITGLCHSIRITGGINRCFITWVFLSSPSPPRAVLWWNLLAHAAALLAPSSFSCKFPLREQQQQQRTDSECWLAPVQCSRQLTCVNAQWYQSRLLSHSQMTFCALAEMFAVKQICSLYVIFKGWKWTSYMHLLNEINTQPNIITHVNW